MTEIRVYDSGRWSMTGRSVVEVRTSIKDPQISQLKVGCSSSCGGDDDYHNGMVVSVANLKKLLNELNESDELLFFTSMD